ncbi:MAG: ParB/RepB/Spo0J family partition protein [bacterium]
MKTQGLGRGLSALLGNEDKKAPITQVKNVKVTKTINVEKSKPVESSSTNKENLKEAEYKYIPVDTIDPNPYQPRTEFDEGTIDELAQSISQSGFITPILVNKLKDGKYVLVAGERRLRACKKLGLYEIPAVIKQLSEIQMMQIAIVENVQRKNLNAIEEAKAYLNMQKRLGFKSEKIASILGLPHYYIVLKLKLNNLPELIQQFISSGDMSEGAGIALLKLDSDDAMLAAAKIVVRQHMSRISTEKLVEKILLSRGVQPKGPNFQFRSKYQYMVDAFKDTLGWNVKLKNSNNGRGKIEIEFDDEMDLKDIYKQFEKVLK